MAATLPPDPDLEELLEHLRVERGADFTGYKRTSLTRLITRRMAAAGVEGFRAYQDRLEVDPRELAVLLDSLLIKVTSFYRDAATWDALRARVLPRLLAQVPDDEPVRVWSAACATGEEAYTLALVLDDLLGREAFTRRVKVYATDVDEGALQVARAATYRADDLGALPEPLRERGFTGTDGVRTVVPEIRSAVVFGRHDLLQDAPISRVTLLTCRNVLMYFNRQAQVRALERLSFALTEGGVLVLGKAEMLLSHAEQLTPLDLPLRVFVRTERGERGQGAAVVALGRRRDGAPVLDRVAHAALVAAPEAQLVLDGAGALALVNDSAVRQLDVRRSDVGRPFQDLEISYRPVELRSSLDRAVDLGEVVELKDVEAGRPGDERWYDVQVLPLVGRADERLGMQITFLDVTHYHLLSQELQTANRELETAYEELQSANEELETTNEELQSAVEELETTNEELQSTNEELETMNDELQSTNEELQTLNDALRDRTIEVDQVNAFLESILSGMRGAVVVLDGELVVRVWNQRAERMWGLREHEATGRHFLNLDIGLPVEALRRGLREVVGEEQEHVELRVEAVNRFGRRVQCAVTISPLRTARGTTSGAIVLMEESEVDPQA